MNEIPGFEQGAFPRLLRPVEAALALYFRPGRNDHAILAQALTEGLTGVRGIIFDPARLKVQQDLLSEASRRGVERVLDTRMMELAIQTAGSPAALASLAWASAGQKQPDELGGLAGKEAAKAIAEFAVGNDFSAVLAPTHYLASIKNPWISVDTFLTQAVRARLDALQANRIPVYYPLAIPAAAFRESLFRKEIVRVLKDLPIDAVWLRVHPFGTTASGPIALRGYIEACQELHQLGIPLVAEKTGTVGIALLAFGAVGGIESGITTGESFDFGRLTRPPKKGRAFLAHPRVYLKELGAFLPSEEAHGFFELRRMKTFFGCRERCCPRGLQDMLGNPRKHFVVTRAKEVARVSSVPVTLRRQTYLEDFLRPATDLALQASLLYPKLDKQGRRLESWRGTLGAVGRENPLKRWSQPPDGRRARSRPRASA